jgi:hypothetical protein
MSNYLEKHRALLDSALAAVADDVLRARIQAEAQRLVDAAARDITDRAFELALVAHLAPSQLPIGPATLLAELAAHPALVALERSPALTLAAATAMIQVVTGPPGRARRFGLTDVPDLRVAAGGGDAFDETVGIVHAAWLAAPQSERPYLERDVAVMLPVRLETLFKPVGNDWELWLRVVPDEASVRRDDPTPKPLEVDLLQRMWQRIYDALTDVERARPFDEWLDTAPGRAEWDVLCDRVSGGRAAWLAGACPPSLDGGVISVNAPNVGNTTLPNRVGGFPRQLEVWAAFANDAPMRFDPFDVAADALEFDVIGARPVTPDTNQLAHERDRWWVSWQAAKDVGLGRIIPLPPGRKPEDIRTLYVIGLGDENPLDHFRAQVDAGEMAKVPLGAPTNAVDGAQAADIHPSTASWRLVARRRMQQRRFHVLDEDALSRSLAGLGSGLPAMPVPDSISDLDQALVLALWPVLWGHQMRDLWGCLEEGDQLAAWAGHYLRPEGPLPPIRIDVQPYGLLPATALSGWRVLGEEGALAQLEPRLQRSLLMLRSHWATIARLHGTAIGANTQRLLDLISRDAVSASYAYRTLFATEVWWTLYGSSWPVSQATFDAWVRQTFRPVYELTGRGPNDAPGMRHFLAGGGYRQLKIPLVVPNHWPVTYYVLDGPNPRLDDNGRPILLDPVERSFARLVETLLTHGHRHVLVYEQWRGVLPDSLLIRLLVHAGVQSAAAVAQVDGGPPAPIREPLISYGPTRLPTTLLDQLSQGYEPDKPHIGAAGEVRRMLRDGLERLFKFIGDQPPTAGALVQLERAFRATLDTATHRIDPWIVGMAARRLEYLRNQPEARFRLGVYGWVDGPIRGAPGPNRAGILHAPSHAQALTGAILRDKEITEELEASPPAGQRDLWSMQLESQRLRLAEELAEEVRLGSHVFEALGRRVEHVIGVRTMVGPVVEATSRVDVLRTTYPMKAGQPDRGRVCHGVNALAGLLGDPPLPLETTPDQRAELELLRQVMHAYGDLLVAEAVHQVVSGHADRAGAAMDAAAGLSTPPNFDFSETPLAADGMTTSVVGVIPYVAPPPAPGTGISPARMADASVAAALEQLVGPANTWTWLIQGATATLADLGLEPADTLVLSPDLLDDLARARLDVAGDARAGGDGRRRHTMARDIARALGSQPAFLRDLSAVSPTPAEVDQRRALDGAILDELRTRYGLVRDSAQLMIDELSAARTAGDAALLRQALFRALRWGVTPSAGRDQLRSVYAAMMRNALPEQVPLLSSFAERAEQSLRERLSAAPPLATSEPLGRAIAELAAPEGQLPVLSRIAASTLTQASRLRIDAPDAELDTQWLTVVAAVRPRLATVEALQLEALPVLNAPAPGFTAWSSAPSDPWQTAALATLRRQRLQAGGTDPRLVPPRFTVAYTVGNVWQPGPAGIDPTLAAGLIDSWSEAAPRARQRTTAVFGFSAPVARPPQAILLAVPPDLGAGFGVQLDTAGLIQILEETRELAHARAVDAEALGTYLAAVPMTMFAAADPSGVHLGTSTVFPS